VEQQLDGLLNRRHSVVMEAPELLALAKDWRQDLTASNTEALAATLAQLGQTARQVLVASLDASIAKVGSQRLGEITGSAE
jgi:hypothetical protein